MHRVDRDTADLSDPRPRSRRWSSGSGGSTSWSTTPAAWSGRSAGRSRRSRPTDWRAVVDANLTSAFLCTRAVVPGMKAAGAGRIVNISSGAGRSVSLTGIQAYASAKAGQIGFTRQMAHELGPFGITVNCIAPGLRPLEPDDPEAVGELRRGRPAPARRADRAAPPRHARGHRQRRPLLRLGAAVLGHRPDDLASTVAAPSFDDGPRYRARARRLPLRSRRISRGPGAPRRHAAGRPTWVAGKLGGVRRPRRRERRPPGGAGRVARRAGRADDPGLRPLRRAAAGRPAAWTTPPFEPDVRDGARLRAAARRTTRARVMVVLRTAEAFLQQQGGLPLNVRFLIEGEEEVGSADLPAFLEAHRDELAADLVVSADGAMWRPDEPSISIAAKGLVGARPDGARRGLATCTRVATAAPSPNPIHALARAAGDPAPPGRRGRRRGLLRPGAAARRGRAGGDGAGAVRRGGLPPLGRRAGAARRARASRRSSGCGPGRRSRSTGSPAAARSP